MGYSPMKPHIAGYSRRITGTWLILYILLLSFPYEFFSSTDTLLEAQSPPRVIWVSRVPDNGTVWFISYGLVEGEMMLYVVSSSGITFLRLGSGEILRYIRSNASIVFALPIPYIHDGNRFLTTDIVVGTASSLLRINSINGSTMWRIKLSSQVASGSIVDDVDGDRVWDVVAGDLQGNVYLVSSSNGRIIWSRKTSSTPIIGISGLHVYSGSSSSNFIVSAFYPNGTLKWVVNLATGIGNPQPYASYIDVAVDVNGDGSRDVVVATDSSIIMLDGKTGSILWTKPMSLRPRIVSRTLNDCDGDGLHDIVVGTENGVYVLSSTSGKVIWSKPIGYVFSIDNFYWGDLDKDGYKEIVVGSSYGVYMLSGRSGETIWFYEPGSLATSVEWSWIWGSEQDIDGDKNQDPLVGTNNGYILALSASNRTTTTPTTTTVTVTTTVTQPITTTYTTTTTATRVTTTTDTKTTTVTETQTTTQTQTTTATTTVTQAVPTFYTITKTETVHITSPLTTTITSPYTTTITQTIPATITTTLHKTETQTLTTTATTPTIITVKEVITVKEATYIPTATTTIVRSLFSEETVALGISIAIVTVATLIGLRLRRR